MRFSSGKQKRKHFSTGNRSVGLDSAESTTDMAAGSRMYDNLTGEEFQHLLERYFHPNTVDWIGVPIFIAIFLTGLTGNSLVVFVVARNTTMRTVTNIFLVNLALADFLVLVFCLPLTALWDMTRTWWFGTAVCKAMLYFQNVSVTVSVLTLVCISVERWFAICNPLQFMNTFERTRNALIFVWMLGLILCIPEAVTLRALPFPWEQHRSNFSSTLATTCRDTWGEETQKMYQLIQTVVLFVIPLSVIAIMYGQIAFVLWLKSVPPSDESAMEMSYENNGVSRTQTPASALLTVPNERPPHRRPSSLTFAVPPDNSRQREILTRRKAAKMLIAVVALFAICYLPVHVYNILRTYGVQWNLEPSGSSAVNLACRSLTYFNSSINPILYNFMSEKFQGEFRRACCCLPAKFRSGRPHSTHEAATLLHRSPSPTPIHQRLWQEKREMSVHL